MRIRRATPADAAALSAIAERCFVETFGHLYPPEDLQAFLLDALRFGAPPHGGIAFGIDRIAALMAGTESIRDVIAFPKTTTAQCLMTGAPSAVPDAQLAEVHVLVRPKAE